jgi:hypothetical protein
MDYEDIDRVSHAEVQRLIDSKNENDVIHGLLSAAHYDPDWRWVEQECLARLQHQSCEVRRIAVVCLGHSARIHGTSSGVVVERLHEQRGVSDLAGAVEDALEDIRLFAK